jgi:hypothetical protein
LLPTEQPNKVSPLIERRLSSGQNFPNVRPSFAIMPNKLPSRSDK